MHPQRGEGLSGWPPDSTELQVELNDRQRAFIRKLLEDAINTTRAILVMPHLHEAARTEQQRSLELLIASYEAVGR